MNKKRFRFFAFSFMLLIVFLFGVYAQSPGEIARLASCVDNDGGKNYYQKSSFVFNNVEYSDACVCHYDPLNLSSAYILEAGNANCVDFIGDYGATYASPPEYIKEFYCEGEGENLRVESNYYKCPSKCGSALGACYPIIKPAEGLKLTIAQTYCTTVNFFANIFRVDRDTMAYFTCLKTFDEVVNDPNNEINANIGTSGDEEQSASNEGGQENSFQPTTQQGGGQLLSLRSSSGLSSVVLGNNFEIKCDYGVSNLDCVEAYHGGVKCDFLRFEDTNIVFNCRADRLGRQQNYCRLLIGGEDIRCNRELTEEIQSTEVINVSGQNPLRGSNVPPSIFVGGNFEIKCDYGVANVPCIKAIHDGQACRYAGRFEGSAAVFSCAVGNTTGVKNNACAIFKVDGANNICLYPREDRIENIEVTAASVEPAGGTELSLVYSSATPAVFLNGNVEIKCDYGVPELSCIGAKHGGEACTRIRFDGRTTVVFSCIARSVGIKENYCEINVPGVVPQAELANCANARRDRISISTEVINNYQVLCRSNADCGTNTYENAFCIGKDAYKNYRIYECLNPGNLDSRCTSRLEERRQETCINVCYQGACTRCSANSDCNDGNAATTDVCIFPGLANSVCNNLAIPDCYAGQTRQCGYNNVGTCRYGTQSCGADNRWGDCVGAVMPIAEGTNSDGRDNDCDGGVDEGTVPPAPGCQNQCTSGQRNCQGDGYTLCVENEDGCFVWSGATGCGVGKTCRDGYCVQLPCTYPCTAGERRCDAQYYKVCRDTNGDGCVEWTGRISCGSGKVCVGAGECIWNE